MGGDQVEWSGGRELVKPLLERFTADVAGGVPLAALWAHGSLALGDYQPGRSDLDLVALVSGRIGDAQRARLQRTHEALIRDEGLADKLHCSYVVNSELADAGHTHVTWAMGELYELISKREALEVLARLDAPAEVVRDIHQRRYEAVRPISGQWRFRRAHLARTFVRAAIPRVLAGA